MNLKNVELPISLTELEPGFPRGIYEIETDGTNYEIVLDPALNYVGALLIDKNEGEPEANSSPRLSLVSFYISLNDAAEFVIQDENLKLITRKASRVSEIRLIKLLESEELLEIIPTI